MHVPCDPCASRTTRTHPVQPVHVPYDPYASRVTRACPVHVSCASRATRTHPVQPALSRECPVHVPCMSRAHPVRPVRIPCNPRYPVSAPCILFIYRACVLGTSFVPWIFRAVRAVSVLFRRHFEAFRHTCEPRNAPFLQGNTRLARTLDLVSQRTRHQGNSLDKADLLKKPGPVALSARMNRQRRVIRADVSKP